MTHAAVLGAGVTGLAAGMASGLPVYEACESPGGICASYYVSPDGQTRSSRPFDECYRFELGGGHWLFGGDRATLALINSLAPCRSYTRRSAVDLGRTTGRVAFPLQHHLAQLGTEIAARALSEIESADAPDRATATMSSWLRAHFGPTLCDLFFDPFHERYTAGLYGRIAPQDQDKSPVQRDAVRAGAAGESVSSGYNQQFVYPVDGLDALTHAMADRADVRYGHRIVAIDTERRELRFADGTDVGYTHLLSSLPLVATLSMASIDLGVEPDPYTSVLVLNIGATPGPALGDDHWVYDPRSSSGFHRFGVYSNVDDHFLPRSTRSHGTTPASRASLYVEVAYPGGARPSSADEAARTEAVVRELQDREVLGEVDVVDATWIDVAYTWSWPGSTWREAALAALDRAGIRQIGRYGRWEFQGIATSIAEGLRAGEAAGRVRAAP
jgi:protoporphyrinogen oxidase